jgi:putative methionine-R-sulfoxide reductase with GAF domain
MVPSQVIFKREQDPTESLPLAYREYVYAVPPGSSEAAAAMLMQRQLELVRSSLERMPPGKLVNLAVFDMAFQGKPPVPPLATLAWKDWRGAPVVAFPRRGTPYAGSSPPPAMAQAEPAPAPMPAPPVAVFPADTAVYIAGAPANAQDATGAPARQPPPGPFTQPAPNPFAQPAPNPFAQPGPNPFAQPGPAPAPFPGLAPMQMAPAPAPFPGLAPPQIAPATAPFVQAPIASPSHAPQPVYAPVPPQVLEQSPPSTASPASPWRQRPAVAVAAPTRASGEDLIAFLFEQMHEVHFARDAVEGGAFCLGLAMEKLPSLAALVELYDINHREFLVTSTRGADAGNLLLRRFPESDPLLSLAMRKRRAVVVTDATETEAATNERYVVLGGARSLIVAPMMVAGRFLGAIELVNPIDGQPFTESDGNAITYMAEQFAEFVAARGVVTDPERIAAVAQELRA